MTFILTFMAPIFEILPAFAAPEAPKSNHLPQISIPVPGGVKVNTWNGNLFLPVNLLNIPGRGIPIDLTLSYNTTWFQTESNYGFGWQFSYNIAYEVKSNGDIVVVWQDGRSQKFVKDGTNFISPVDTHDSFTQYEAGKYRLVTKEGTIYYFEDSNHKKITKITDTNGNPLTFQYNTDKLISKIIDSANREVTLLYTDKRLTNIIDPNTTPTREVHIYYDTNKNLTKITDPSGYAINFEYDTNHFLTKIKDKKDVTTSLSYANGVVANVSNDSGSSTYFGFDKKEYITSVIQTGDFNKHLITRYDYDAEGRISKFYKVKDGNGNTNLQEFTWDGNNNLTSFKDELGRVTNYTYDSKGNILTVVTPTGTSAYTYDPTYSRLTSEKDPNNNTTTYEYDTKGNLTKSIDAKGRETIYTYDANGDLLTEKNARNSTTTFGYNTQGYQTSVTNPLTHTNISTYDNAGRLLTATDANNNSISFEYDINGNKIKATDANGKFETYAYDKNGKMVSKTDTNLNTTTYEYDKLNRLIREVDAENNATLYVYNKLGLLEKLIDPSGNTTEYEYDWLGQLVKETDPAGKVTWHEYDAVGNKNKTTDPNGNNVYYTYDNSNRLTFVDYSDNTKDTAYTYDAAGNTLTESNSTVTVTRTYNELNHTTSVQTATNGLTKIVAYMYDEVGNRSQMLDPDGGETFYTYDAANRLTEIKDPSNQITKYTYDNAGRTTKKELGNSSYTDYGYDNLNRLTTLTNKKSDGTVISIFGYTYDFSVNRTSMTANGQTTNYTYDKIYRLTDADYPGTAFENFTYDQSGNRLTKVDQNGTTNYTYDSTNKLLTEGTNSYSYDNNGNQTTSRGQTFEYDIQNSLKKVYLPNTTTNEYTYYPDGKRLSMKNTNGDVTYYFYDGVNDLVETNASGSTQTRYTSSTVDGWLNMKQGNTQSYYLTDGLGSTSELVDSNQNVANTYTYKAFGKISNQTGSVNNSFTYTGRRTDWDTNHYHYRARYYDPVAGRFTQKDPAGLVDGMNMYIYARNNSINYADPTGMVAPLVAVGLAFLYGSMVTVGMEGMRDYIDNSQYDYADRWESYVGAIVEGPYYGIGFIVGKVNPWAGSAVAAYGAGVSNVIQQGLEIYVSKDRENFDRKDLDRTMTQSLGFSAIDEGTGLLDTEVVILTLQFVYELFPSIRSNSTPRPDSPSPSTNRAASSSRNGSAVFVGSISCSYAELGCDKSYEKVNIYEAGGQYYAAPVFNGSTSGGEWKVDWFVDKNMNHHMKTTTLSSDTNFLNFDWGSGAPGGDSPAGADHYAARFERLVYFPQKLFYQFKVQANDGYRLYIDNNLVSEEWWNGSHDASPTRELTADWHRIRLDFYEDTGDAQVKLSWQLDPDRYGGVWLCTVTGYFSDHRENCEQFTTDVPFLGDTSVGNDRVKSISIVGDWEAALFKHIDYNSPERNLWEMQHFTGSWADLDEGNSNVKRNSATSLRVMSKNDPKASLFERGDYNGKEFKVSQNIEYLRDFSFNDEAESIKVKSGFEAVVCSSMKMGGECGRTKTNRTDIRELRSELREPHPSNQGTASSITVCEGSCPAVPMRPQNVIPSNNATFATGNPVTFQWFGNGDDYSIEIWGGALTQKIVKWVGEPTFYTRTDLQPSANPYYWKVRSWNNWGDSSYSHEWSFNLNHLPVQDIAITGETEGLINTDYQIDSRIIPNNATTPVTYTWSPAPKSGQGTITPIYNFTTPGEKTVKLTTSNPAGTFTQEHIINIECLEGQYYVDYFNGTDLIENASTDCTDTISQDWGNLGPANTGQIPEETGNGQHGSLTISTNTVDTPIDSVANGTINSTTLSATNPEFSTGQKILIHQTLNPSSAGSYQINEIISYTPGNIQLKYPLEHTFVNDTASRAQVLVVKEYTNVTVNPGVTWSAKPWGGSTGGILYFMANGIVTVNGVISANGLGSKGAPATTGNKQHGRRGAANYAGVYATIGYTALGNGGGGGGNNIDGAGSGGGGGGHATNGIAGIIGHVNPGAGGYAIGNPQLDKLYFGGGGGSGGSSYSATSNGAGGNGGGIIVINSNKLVVNNNGSISSNGQNGYNTEGHAVGAGGGGAGGSILLKAMAVTIDANKVTALRGEGGRQIGSFPLHGGAGSPGRIAIQYCDNISGTSNPIFNETQIVCEKEDFSARYTKTQNFTAGTYKFSAKADDGIKVWIDDELLIDDWTSGYKEKDSTTTLTEGDHNIKVEYMELTGEAKVSLEITEEVAPPVVFTGEYFSNKTLTGTPVLTNTTENIDYTWTGSPGIGVASNAFSVRWTGNLDIETPGDYTFKGTGDDGIRLFVDNIEIFNGWKDQGPSEYLGLANLTAGIHVIRYEFYDNSGGAVAKLSWVEGNTLPFSTACTTNNNEYCASMYNNTTLTGTPVITGRDVGPIDYRWVAASPRKEINANNFSGRWVGNFHFNEGIYKFTYKAEDGMVVRIDNNTVVNKWINTGVTETSFTRTMTEGLHEIKVDFKETTVDASVKFVWEEASEHINIAPQVNQIPGQRKTLGQQFSPINLNDYVTDQNGDVITWNYSGNTDIGLSILNGVATITAPDNWVGINNITFTATDPGGLSASTTAAFKINAPPVVSQIPGQTITQGESFTTINLSNYVTDPGDTISWSRLGNTNLTVTITNNIATITAPVGWTGTNNVMFTARDSGGLTHSSTAEFTVQTPSPVGTELLTAPWNLSGNDGASERYQTMDTSILENKTTMRITYDLHGLNALGGDASAIIFDQDGWQYISLSEYGQNGLNGVQTVDIPLTEFSNLDLTEGSNMIHTRFWYGSAFTVDITSIKVF